MGELLAEREQVLQDMFHSYDVAMKGGLSAEQLQLLHSQLRVGGISIPQVGILFETRKQTFVFPRPSEI